MIFVQKGFWIRLVVYISSWIVYSDYRAEKEGRSFMKRLTILCAALTAAMFMNMSAYAGTSEVAAEVSAGTVCLPGADLTDVMGCGSIFSDQHPGNYGSGILLKRMVQFSGRKGTEHFKCAWRV